MTVRYFSQLLDQATTRLGLTQAARRIYTVRGELITDVNQLVRPYNITMVGSLDEMEELADQVTTKVKVRDPWLVIFQFVLLWFCVVNILILFVRRLN